VVQHPQIEQEALLTKSKRSDELRQALLSGMVSEMFENVGHSGCSTRCPLLDLSDREQGSKLVFVT